MRWKSGYDDERARCGVVPQQMFQLFEQYVLLGRALPEGARWWRWGWGCGNGDADVWWSMLVNFFFSGKCTTLLLISLQHLPIGKPREINVFFLTEWNENICGNYLVHVVSFPSMNYTVIYSLTKEEPWSRHWREFSRELASRIFIFKVIVIIIHVCCMMES